MNQNNYLEQLKLRLILLNIHSVINLLNINNFSNFLNELDDDNVLESYHKLLKLDYKNKLSLYNVLSSFNNEEIDLNDLMDQVTLLDDNYILEDQYFFNIISYLLIIDDYSINGEDLVVALDEFLDIDRKYIKEFNNNYKVLEIIREENKNE